MNKFLILSLFIAVVTAVPTRYESEETRLSNALIEKTELFDSPMLDFEIDYELNNFETGHDLETLAFLPDQVRDKIVEQLRMTAVQIHSRILNLIKKIDNEIEKLENAYSNTGNAFYKGKLWTQIHSLKLLKTVTQAGLDKFHQYIVSENSKVLENLVKALENLFEAKFFKFSVLARQSLRLLQTIQQLA